ncbi:glycosyltransferase [uncultured Shimia sp.]|uniref:glycosyltransferase n=1 Tax=uncultured Shimia sp. TaxID=573152 RepID=UPI00261349CB|nr:glycosyltransferase [uncultured Shimia sp.]
MNSPILAFEQPRPAHMQGRQVSFGRHLIESGQIAPWQLFHAFDRQHSCDATLSEILVSKGWIRDEHLMQALSLHYTAQLVDLDREPPNPDLSDLLPPEICLKHNILPWRTVGGILVVVTGRPERFEALRHTLPARFQTAILAICDESAIVDHLARTRRIHLTNLAETRVASIYSCRNWEQTRRGTHRLGLALLTAFVVALVSFPAWVLAVLTLWAALSLFAVSVMKVAAFASYLRNPIDSNLTPRNPSVLPRISVMVPLFREKEIAQALVARLSRLTYPKALLDVLLVLEEHDDLTKETIARTSLPNWMRVVEVPAGSGLTTKPRALNYALDQCRGDIVGIWDAEDAPAPNQLEMVAAQFAKSPPKVVCLQGILDFYNPRTNWLSRCFTIEYATWFRCILPGPARLGFALPLGGTTLFIRRDAIEELGGWDAHNVTEDADLGIRLARHGYRTEMLPSVTLEEANCTTLAWIRQRSRWLKGYIITYLVHMRDPRLIWSELGLTGFLGMQLVFLCTLSQFLLAPLLWAFGGQMAGLPYPGQMLFSDEYLVWVITALLASGIINIVISAASVHGQNRTALLPYVLTLPIYFTLACAAGYKALFELLKDPYYWDKTDHGKTKEGTSAHHSGVDVLFKSGDEGL